MGDGAEGHGSFLSLSEVLIAWRLPSSKHLLGRLTAFAGFPQPAL